MSIVALGTETRVCFPALPLVSHAPEKTLLNPSKPWHPRRASEGGAWHSFPCGSSGEGHSIGRQAVSEERTAMEAGQARGPGETGAAPPACAGDWHFPRTAGNPGAVPHSTRTTHLRQLLPRARGLLGTPAPRTSS